MNTDYTFICMLQAPLLYGHAHQASPTSILLPLFLSFQPPAAQGDIFAAEDSKKKTKPKGTKKEKSKKPKGRSDKDLSGTTNHIFGDSWLLLKPRASPKTKKKKKGGTNYSKTSFIWPSN